MHVFAYGTSFSFYVLIMNVDFLEQISTVVKYFVKCHFKYLLYQKLFLLLLLNPEYSAARK